MVTPNGNVSISWVIPSDPNNEFKSYEVFYSTNQAGPYTNLASLPSYIAFTYNSVGLNANAQPYFFYIQVKNTANQLSPAIDTVKTIFLTMNSPANSSIAFVSWNNFHSPLPAGESNRYKV